MKESESQKDEAAAIEATEGRISEPSLETSLETSLRRARVPRPPGPGCARVSLEAEVPEALFNGMREFIRNHPQWDQYSVITSALAVFLFQNGARDTCVKDHYFSALFSDS